MPTLIRLIACALVLTALTISIVCITTSEAPGELADLWELPGLPSRIQSEQFRQAALQREGTEIMQRIKGKERIVEQLAAGELTMTEAAIHFRILVAGQPRLLAHLRNNYRGRTDDERFCRQVIAWSDDLGPCLEEQLEALLARVGKLHLTQSVPGQSSGIDGAGTAY